MKIKLLPLVGWLCFYAAIGIQAGILAAHTAQRRMPLGGSQPHLQHTTLVWFSSLAFVFLLLAWVAAVESGQYWLLFTMAVAIALYGSFFGRTLVSWESNVWGEGLIVVVLGVPLAMLSDGLKWPHLLPQSWRAATLEVG